MSGHPPFAQAAALVDSASTALQAVRDHGRWRDSRSGPGGRGIEMMRSLMDEVEVTPAEGGTTVHLRRAVARGAAV